MKRDEREFMRTLLWSSCRYFIGRHTIAAAMHPADIAKYLHAHPKDFNENHNKSLARDIRREINNHVNFSTNVSITGEGNVDALTLMVCAIKEHLDKTGEHIDMVGDWRTASVTGVFQPGHWKYHIDLVSKTCELEYHKPEVDTRSYGPHPVSELLDLVPWIQLAGWLDPNETIIYNDLEGVEHQVPGFAFPSIGTYVGEDHPRVEILHCPAEEYIKKPSQNVSIVDKAIVRIEPMGGN